MIPKMKAVEAKDAIAQLLNRFAKTKKKNKITLWQSIENDEKMHIEARIKFVDMKKAEVVFLPRKERFKFDVKLPIYFYSKLKTTIFKNMIFYNSANKIAIKIPDKVMLEEFRKTVREQVADGELFVYFMYGEKHRLGHEHWFKSPVIERSKEGLSFKMSPHNVIRLETGEKLQMRFSDNEEIFSGEVSHTALCMSIGEDAHKYERVGVKFL